MRHLATHEKNLIVGAQDIDELNHVNNVIYLKWVQDIAREHWIRAAPDHIKDQLAWVVISHFITYKKPCFLSNTSQSKD